MSDKPSPFSEAYYEGNGQCGDRPALRFFARLARRYIPGRRLLDFGCGPGFFLKHLAAHFDVFGLEISPWARRHAHETTGRPVYGSLEELADQSLDGIVSLHVIEHIPDEGLESVVREWKRVLVPGARLLLVTPDAGGHAARVKDKNWIALTDPTHINLKSHSEWREFFESRGFLCLEGFADGLWDFPYSHRWLGRAEVLLRGWPTLFQFLLARPIIAPGKGESVIFVLEKRG